MVHVVGDAVSIEEGSHLCDSTSKNIVWCESPIATQREPGKNAHKFAACVCSQQLATYRSAMPWHNSNVLHRTFTVNPGVLLHGFMHPDISAVNHSTALSRH